MFSGAARLRALVGARGGARCARCGSLVLAGVVDVDHVQPLALGGEDTDTNVQPLCRDCHQVKTGEDFSKGQSSPT
ncbi:HNH endonuclease signature motif containing protein [Streptomyces griseus]|uniref:HNH endonuclease n=1 Tax=Streptomyces TaxID=1883 RepID=UPI0023789D6F|nr:MULTISPECIES: HNH endonuclease signature motif containing protein [unclassified Streptomyces]